MTKWIGVFSPLSSFSYSINVPCMERTGNCHLVTIDKLSGNFFEFSEILKSVNFVVFFMIIFLASLGFSILEFFWSCYPRVGYVWKNNSS